MVSRTDKIFKIPLVIVHELESLKIGRECALARVMAKIIQTKAEAVWLKMTFE